MGSVKLLVFSCVLCSIGIEAGASDMMERSGEVSHPDTENDSDSHAIHHPENVLLDSHEAMNDRQGHVEMREKRSFEFLVGLINNNSRYEVTRVDPEQTTQKPKIVADDVAASEILLELMVRIAAHPEQWSRVHKLLKSIDDDLTTSKNVIKKLKVDRPRSSSKINESTSENRNTTGEKDATTHSGNGTFVWASTKEPEKTIKPMSIESTWPTFAQESDSKEGVVNRSITKQDGGAKSLKLSQSHKPSRSTYPKNFAYHRVTGNPIDVKSPKAYIAVSVIAPGSSKSRPKDESIALENELHQLKPWTHQTNLQKMASIRSRWIVGDKSRGDSGS